MKITKEEDYAVLLMHALLTPGGKDYLSITEIASKYRLSKFFLKKIAKKLREADLIKSKEGVKGGYILAKNPNSVSYVDILTAISGPIDISPSCNVCTLKVCKHRGIWADLNQKITDILNQIKISYFKDINL